MNTVFTYNGPQEYIANRYGNIFGDLQHFSQFCLDCSYTKNQMSDFHLTL